VLTDEIRELRAARPFQPFIIRLADGVTQHVIRAPDTLILTADGIMALVDAKEQLHILNPMQIAQVTLERTPRASRSSSKA
jgi:hypothetical protein